jgi:phage/plasmid-like protein (TIGR03299 family)
MSANIWGSSFFGRKPAWHSLGTVIPPDQKVGVLDAMELANATYEVRLEPITVHAFDQVIETGKLAIMRAPTALDPEARMLGVVGDKYQPVQNRELGTLLADLSEAEGWPVETVGVLGMGERIFATLSTEVVEIEGDGGVQIYFLVTTGHDGGTATKIACTPVRIVCQNTLIMGLQQAIINASVVHRGDAVGEVEWNMGVVAQMKKAQDAVTEAMRIMATPASLLDHEEVEDVLEAAYPSIIRDTAAISRARQMIQTDTISMDEARRKGLTTRVSRKDAWVQTVQEYKGAARARLMVMNDEHPAVANTAWAVYNAVVETEQYRRGRSDATIGRDVLFGGFRGQNMANAFNAAYALATAKN